MAARLNTTVWLRETPASEPVSFGPDDTDIPKWARDQIGAHCYADDAQADDGDSGSSYDDLKVDELKAEIDRRNADRSDDDQIDPDGSKKADLVAALEADDAAQG